jgi:hypothetical protein
MKERDQLEVLGVNGRIILKWILKEQCSIHLAQDRDKWQAAVNTIISSRVF